MKNLFYNMLTHALGHVLFFVVVALGIALYFFDAENYPYKWYAVGGLGFLICLIFLLVRRLPSANDVEDE